MSDHRHEAAQSDPAPPVASDLATTETCCRWWPTWAGPILVGVTIIASCTAAYFAGRNAQLAPPAAAWLDSLPITQTAASANKPNAFSIATGQASDDAEGVFVLDHNSGLLQCNVIYPRTARFMAQFTTNVGDALGTSGKAGDYLMVTGTVNFPRASNRPAAPTIVYVLDTATGDFACYGIPFDRAAVATNRAQQGALILLHTGKANPVIDRDDLR